MHVEPCGKPRVCSKPQPIMVMRLVPEPSGRILVKHDVLTLTGPIAATSRQLAAANMTTSTPMG